MNVERGIFDDAETPEQAAALDARIAELAAAAMQDPAYRARFGPEHDAERLAQARADIAAGRVVSHEKVVEWLRTWGTPEAGPPPREWFE